MNGRRCPRAAVGHGRPRDGVRARRRLVRRARRRPAHRRRGRRDRPGRPAGRVGRRQRIGYDALLLATGSTPRPLDVPGAYLDGVLQLRTLADSDRIAAALRRRRPAGHRRRRLDRAGGRRRRAAARRHRHRRGTRRAAAAARARPRHRAGVRRPAPRARGRPSASAPRCASSAATAGCPRSCCATAPNCPPTLVLVGVGVHPNVALAETAGLAVDNGVVVDQAPAQQRPAHLRRRRRRQRLPPAVRHASAGRALGQRAAPGPARGPLDARARTSSTTGCRTSTPTSTTWAWSTPATPRPAAYDSVVVRGDLAKREFIAFWTAGGRVLAGMNVNVWDVTRTSGT